MKCNYLNDVYDKIDVISLNDVGLSVCDNQCMLECVELIELCVGVSVLIDYNFHRKAIATITSGV